MPAGPYSITKFQEKGTTVFKPNPYFYGPKSNAEAVAMTYYTNSTSMIADLQAGNIDFADQVPYNAISSLKSDSRFDVQSVPSSEVTNITINSNPLKPKNRELLDPKVREALEYATDRNSIVKVIYAGHARPWANMLSLQSGAFWLNPAIKPLPFDIAKANQILDSLGYKRGAPDGIRVVPATTGKYAQPAHKMEYDVIVPDSLDFNGDRQFQIIANDWEKIGIKLHEVAGGDSGQAYGLETAGKYTKFDFATWDWAEYVDPDAQLSYMTRDQWYSWSDTGYNNPLFNKQYLQQATLIDPKQRQALVWKMEAEVAHDRPYIQLVDEDTRHRQRQGVDGLLPRPERLLQVLLHEPAQDRMTPLSRTRHEGADDVRGMDYVVKRTAFAIVTVFVAITLNFILFRALPGNAVTGLRCGHCTKQFRESLVKQYGLDKSKWQQYVIYIERLAHGDLGTSSADNRPVWDDIKAAAREHAADGRRRDGDLDRDRHHLGGGGRLAARHGRRLGQPVDGARLLRDADPVDRPAGDLLHRDPARACPRAGSRRTRSGSCRRRRPGRCVSDRISHLFLPALTLGIGLYGEYSLVVRSSMLETLGEDYVLTARAKGLRNWAIVWKHALRNAMLPLVTLIALSLGSIVAGAIVVEDVFSYPGIGLATIDAINHRDYPVLQGIFLLLTLSVIFANFVADLIYFKLDPRVTT